MLATGLKLAGVARGAATVLLQWIGPRMFQVSTNAGLPRWLVEMRPEPVEARVGWSLASEDRSGGLP